MSVTAGIVDPTFTGQPAPAYKAADGGIAIDSVYGTAVAADGDIVVAGTGGAGVAVARLLPNGAPDTAFGDDGFNTYGADVLSVAGVAVAPNGNILVAINDGGPDQAEIVSFPASGGAATETEQVFNAATSAYASTAYAMTLLPNGDVALAGEGQPIIDQHGDPGPREFAVACVVANTLAPDTTFNFADALPTSSGLSAIAPALNGGIAVAGYLSSGEPTVELLNANGSVNTTFKPDLSHAGSPLAGAVAGVFSVVVQPGGQIDVVSTDPDTNTDVTRFTATGALDTTFNGTGYRTIELFYPRSAYAQSDGKLVLGGTDGDHDTVALFRLNANGTPDATFGVAATGQVDLGTQEDATFANTMSVDGDGRIVIAADELVDTGSGELPETGVFRVLPGEYAYPPAAVTLPGSVYAASYDNGGEGVAYHDTDDVNSYASPGREDGVDISSTAGNTVGHGIVGYTYPGEYLKYTVTVATAGNYALSILGGNVFGTGGTFHLEDTNGTHLTGEVTAAAASLTAYTTFSAGTVTLSAGTHVLKLAFDTAGAHGLVTDLDYMTFTAVASKGTVTGTVTGGVAGETLFLDANNNGSYDAGEATTTTGSTGAYTFSSVAPGSYFVRQELATTSAQTAPAAGAGLAVTVTAGGTVAGKNFTDVASGTKLAGTAIGTAGSYGNGGNTIAKALDGSLTTFFDGPTASGDTVGLDLGKAYSLTAVAFASRPGWATRMNGGSFQASNSATFATGNVTLYTIPANTNPTSTALARQAVTGTYRYVRYVAPANTYGDVAEVQFFGSAPAPVRLTGTTSGTAGSYGNSGNTVAKATDGSLTTFFDGPTASGDSVVVDLGSAKTVTQIEFAPRSGWASRMVGGVFQASNSSTFASGVATIYTVGSTPATGTLTTVATNTTTAYRYWRYVAPANSYGDIAEFELFG